MQRVIWTAVLAVITGVAAVVVSVVLHDYPATAVCLAALSITFALLSNREGS